MRVVSHLIRGVVIAVACVALAPGLAAADKGEAVDLLISHGGISKRDARKVVKKVSARMAESADNFAPDTDPLRVALSRSMFGTDVPSDRMKAAKVRLRLFAGPSAETLKAIFAPGGGQIAACRANFKLPKKYCEALVAAGGQVSVAEARSADSGASKAVASAPAARPQPKAAPAASSRKSRFARYDSGYRASASQSAKAAAPAARAAAPAKQAPKAAAQPAAVQSPSATRQAYLARREAYLARQKARMEAAKARRTQAYAAKSPAPEPAAAPASAPAEPAAGADMDFTASADEPAAAPAPQPEQKQQLSNDFLNGLLADPLGE